MIQDHNSSVILSISLSFLFLLCSETLAAYRATS